jgi:hypothetical protein
MHKILALNINCYCFQFMLLPPQANWHTAKSANLPLKNFKGRTVRLNSLCAISSLKDAAATPCFFPHSLLAPVAMCEREKFQIGPLGSGRRAAKLEVGFGTHTLDALSWSPVGCVASTGAPAGRLSQVTTQGRKEMTNNTNPQAAGWVAD